MSTNGKELAATDATFGRFHLLLIALPTARLRGQASKSHSHPICFTLFLENKPPFNILPPRSIVQNGHGKRTISAESQTEFAINFSIGLVLSGNFTGVLT